LVAELPDAFAITTIRQSIFSAVNTIHTQHFSWSRHYRYYAATDAAMIRHELPWLAIAVELQDIIDNTTLPRHCR